MSLSIEHKYHPKERALIIHVEGEFKGINAVDFEKDILGEIRSGKAKNVVFELSKVVYVDSAAIEFLFSCAKVCKDSGQSIKLSQPRDNIRKLFNILRVEQIIPIDK